MEMEVYSYIDFFPVIEGLLSRCIVCVGYCRCELEWGCDGLCAFQARSTQLNFPYSLKERQKEHLFSNFISTN